MPPLLSKILSPEHLIPEGERLGELPPMKSACGDIFKMAWPVIVEFLLLRICSVMDTAMVGVLGTNAISAVGVSSPSRQLITAAYNAIGVAVTAIVARRIGEGNKESAGDTLKQSIAMVFILSLAVIPLGYIFCDKLLLLNGCPDTILEDAMAYFRIWLLGVPLWAISVPINAANRASGRPILATVSNVVANTVNVVFNYLLIGGNLGFPALGVRGAATATAICYFVQMSIAFISVLGKKSPLRLDFKKKFRFTHDVFTSIRAIAPAYFLEQIVWFFGNVIITRIINSLGSTDAYAAWQIALTLYSLLTSVAQAFMSATIALVGQNLGKRREDLAVMTVKLSAILALLCSSVFIILYGFFGDVLVGFYISDPIAGAATAKAASTMLVIIAAGSPISILLCILTGCLRGAGDSKITVVVGLLSQGIVRPVCFYIFCNIPAFGVVGAWISIVIDEIIRTLIFYIRFKRGKWKYIRL